MKKILLFALIVVSAVVTAKTITCEGTYKGHLQGIDSDGQFIYWSFTNAIVKTDMEGKVLIKVDALRHSGDPCLLNGKLYVPVNRGRFNQPIGASKDSIQVYDAETLNLLKTVPITEYPHGAGAIGTFNNHIFLTGGLTEGSPSNIIIEYTEELEFVKRHESQGFTKRGIQTLKRMHGFWWAGVYDKPPIMLCDDNFTVLARPSGPGLSVGMAALKDGTILVARTKLLSNPDDTKNRIWNGTISTATYDAEKKAIVLKND
ncbi:MAG: hypothetical protein IKP00_03925 [Victivallales bacterium]|nr:hypothetical protein [Victivallales bacterium]